MADCKELANIDPRFSPSIMASSASSPSSSASLLPGLERPLSPSSSSITYLQPPITLISHDNSQPWMEIEKVYQLQQREQDAKDMQRLNQETSWLLKCPPEVVSWIIVLLADALDIRNLLQTCSLLSKHWASWDWFEHSKRRFPNWYREASLGDLPDTELHFQRPGPIGLTGQGTIVASNWKRIVVRDAALRRRLGRPLPALNLSDDQNNNDVAHLLDPTQEPPLYLPERDQKHLRVLLDEAQYFPSDTKTESENWYRVSSPVYNIDLDSETTLSASMLARKGENADQFEFRVLIYALPNLTDPIAICDSKMWEVDQHVDYDVARARDARRHQQQQAQNIDTFAEVAETPQTPAASQQNAPLPTRTPENRPTVNRPWHDPFTANELPVIQLVELKHSFSSSTKTTQGKNSKGRTASEMKVIFALAFGQNVGEDDMLLLDVWRLVKVVEITIPSVLRDQDRFVTVPMESLPPPVLVQVETIEVSAEEDMRARMVKIYTVNVEKAAPIQPAAPAAPAPPTLVTPISKEENPGLMMVNKMLSTQSTMVDIQTSNASVAQPTFVTKTCIAIFGIQNADTSSALMLRKVIFAPSRNEGTDSLCRRTISRGVSCMTLFPYQSGYDRLLVLYNRHGRGMIWDWVNENQVAQLRMPDDAIIPNARPADTPNAPPAGGVVAGNANAAAAAANNNNNNNNNNAQAGSGSSPNRRRLSYWGVQVSFSETPNPFTLNQKERRTFKIVTLADGQEDEWESCFWNVDSLMLGPTDSELPEQSAFVPIKIHHPLSAEMRRARDYNMRYIRRWRLEEQAKLIQSAAAAAAAAAAGANTTTLTTTTVNTTTATATTTATPTASTPSVAPHLYAISKRSEVKTLGVKIPMEARKWGPTQRQQWIESVRASEPVRFNAYVVWNRYRISLTTDQGLVIVDLEEEGSDENRSDTQVRDAPAPEPDREWVQYLHHLKDAPKNSLVDIATVNNSLVITMKLGHLVWPFYGPSNVTEP